VFDVTADSNIYVSALEFAGTPRRFLEIARAGVFRLSISDWIVEEVSRTLLTKFRWDRRRLSDAVADIAEFTVRVNAPATLSVIAEDPDDDRILECAFAAGARFIVTGDSDLLRLSTWHDIRIVKVAEFMRLIEPAC
jgi:putative PIN family toxin of toxin-antitoxin system